MRNQAPRAAGLASEFVQKPAGVERPGELSQPRRDFNLEARTQAAVVEWVRLVAPHVLAFSIPNGGYRTPAEPARMKWTGTVAGVPDLAIVVPGGRVHFLEVKAPGGSLSAAQRAIHESLVGLGTPPAIVRSLDDVRLAFAAWGIETREWAP
jgi:hypothetical protein